MITGQPFQQFTSQYGNSSELGLFGGQYGNQSGHEFTRLAHEATALGYMAPLLPIALILALLIAIRRRDPRVLVPLAVLGGGLGFILVSYLDNQVFPWYRFYILSIPLEILLVGSIVSARAGFPATGMQGFPESTTPEVTGARPRRRGHGADGPVSSG